MDRSDHDRARWTPLLDGPLADAAAAAISDIANALREPPPESSSQMPSDVPSRRAHDPSLAGGLAGEGLFLSYLGAARADDQLLEIGQARVDLAIDLLASQPMAANLYSGFSGIAWTVAHLVGQAAEPGDPDEEDANDDIDEILFEHLAVSPWRDDYDLISGLVGYGVYALERWPRDRAAAMFERVIDRLAELAETILPVHGDEAGAEPGRQQVTWHTAPALLPEWQREKAPEGYYNLGLAHGVAGVAGLFGVAAGLGVLSPRGHDLLAGVVEWLLAQRLPATEEARWDGWVVAGVDPVPTRSAWCYGDPGIAAALHLAGRGAKRTAWSRAALEAMVGVATRPVEKAGVVDPGLCHGAAGLAHILNRFYQATGDPTIGAAAHAWFERLLSMRQSDRGVAGFASYFPTADGQPRWVDEAGILTGAAGVGLALLAATSSQVPAWDRFLLLS